MTGAIAADLHGGWAGVAIGAVVSVVVCQAVARRLIAARAFLDVPTERSSHAAPTPRSGGIAIFAGWACALGVAAIAAMSPDALRTAATLIATCAGAFLLGLLDDRAGAGAGLKFFGQLVVATLFVAIAGPVGMAPGLDGPTSLGVWSWPLTILWIVFVMNAFNFMDGANGIASSCGALALASLAFAALAAGAGSWAIACAFFAASVSAFLQLNFPSGRIFMGDSGSQLIGFFIAAASVAVAIESEGTLALFGPIALTPFLTDVGLTLVHRAVRKKSLVTAHREHAYQLLLRLGWRHEQSTAVFAALTLLSCAAAAASSSAAPIEQWTILGANALFHSALAALVFIGARKRGLLGGRDQDIRTRDVSARAVNAAE